jgi:chromosome segregation ATPase
MSRSAQEWKTWLGRLPRDQVIFDILADLALAEEHAENLDFLLKVAKGELEASRRAIASYKIEEKEWDGERVRLETRAEKAEAERDTLKVQRDALVKLLETALENSWIGDGIYTWIMEVSRALVAIARESTNG